MRRVRGRDGTRRAELVEEQRREKCRAERRAAQREEQREEQKRRGTKPKTGRVSCDERE